MLLPMLSIYQEYVRNHHYCLQVSQCYVKISFLKKVLGKIFLPNKSQKLPNLISLISTGQFLWIFGWNDFPKYVLKKQTLLYPTKEILAMHKIPGVTMPLGSRWFKIFYLPRGLQIRCLVKHFFLENERNSCHLKFVIFMHFPFFSINIVNDGEIFVPIRWVFAPLHSTYEILQWLKRFLNCIIRDQSIRIDLVYKLFIKLT